MVDVIPAVATIKITMAIVLSVSIFNNGLKLNPETKDQSYHQFIKLTPALENGRVTKAEDYKVMDQVQINEHQLVKLEKSGIIRWFLLINANNEMVLQEMLSTTLTPNGQKLYNGEPAKNGKFYQVGHLSKIIVDGKEVDKTGALGPFEFLATIEKSEIVRFEQLKFTDGDNKVSVWYQNITPGSDMMKPGLRFKIGKDATPISKLNFISLMIALFLGTSALPHILIRYYTVPSQRDARKSTIVAIAAIGTFYILTMFMGLGAAINGVLDVESSNMSAPLLAKAFGIGLFSIISAIAFATILGTVSGLIIASTGAIAHDIIDNYMGKNLSEDKKVLAGKISAFVVGIVAIILGIAFKGMNVSFLVGWAFAVAASANLPSILMLLFWKKTTAKGIAWSIVVGIISALGLILTSPMMWGRYGLNPGDAIHQLNNPAIISFTLALLTLIFVSLATQKDNHKKKDI